MSLSRDPAKAREWAQRSAERARQRQATAPRKRVKPQSDRRKREAAERRVLVRRLLAEHPHCEAQVLCRGAASQDVHERLTRARGGSIVDPEQAHMLCVCRACHDWITTHPREAERRRLMLPSWHRCPPGRMGPC